MATCDSRKVDSNITGLALAEEECLLKLPVAGPAVAASGTLTVNTVPADGDTITVAGTLFTFVDASPGASEILIGANATATATNIATAVDALATVGAAASLGVVTITATTAGSAGNVIGMASSTGNITLSGATLAGGADASGGPVWHGREPNTYADLGGENTTSARSPIDPSRQNKKGTVVDLDASGGWNEDFTKSNMLFPLQGFFFADAREPATTAPVSNPAAGVVITGVVAATKKIVFPTAGLGLAAGQIVFARNMDNPINNGPKTVAAVTANDVTVLETLADETPTADATLQRVGGILPSGDASIVIQGGLTVLQVVATDFTTFPGMIPGKWLFLGGDALANRFANNMGYARIKSVSAKQIVFDDITWNGQAEAGTGKTIMFYVGVFLKNEKDPALIKRRSYHIERTLGFGEIGMQAEYVRGSVANELTVNLPSAEKLTVDLAYVGCDTQYKSGDAGDEMYGGTRINALGEDAYNSSNDLYRLKMSILAPGTSNPTPLFGYVTEGTVTVSNGVTPNKALGVLGAFDTSAGNFVVGGSVTAYFTTVAAVKAVKANADVCFNVIAAARNAGFIFDIPLLGLGGGRLNVEKDAPITIPLEVAGAENSAGYTLSYTQFDYLPNVAMPAVL